MTTPTKPRLIDANTLLKSLDKQWMRDSYLNNERAEYIRQVMNAVHLAPTVETTDDVLARLPDWSVIQKRPDNYVATEDGREYVNASSPIEAVIRLEASINSK